jgi:hypothetical protein
VEKKLPETLAEIRKGRAQGKTIKLMFQDEARFGRMSDVRRYELEMESGQLSHRGPVWQGPR